MQEANTAASGRGGDFAAGYSMRLGKPDGSKTLRAAAAGSAPTVRPPRPGVISARPPVVCAQLLVAWNRPAGIRTGPGVVSVRPGVGRRRWPVGWQSPRVAWPGRAVGELKKAADRAGAPLGRIQNPPLLSLRVTLLEECPRKRHLFGIFVLILESPSLLEPTPPTQRVKKESLLKSVVFSGTSELGYLHRSRTPPAGTLTRRLPGISGRKKAGFPKTCRFLGDPSVKVATYRLKARQFLPGPPRGGRSIQ